MRLLADHEFSSLWRGRRYSEYHRHTRTNLRRVSRCIIDGTFRDGDAFARTIDAASFKHLYTYHVTFGELLRSHATLPARSIHNYLRGVPEIERRRLVSLMIAARRDNRRAMNNKGVYGFALLQLGHDSAVACP